MEAEVVKVHVAPAAGNLVDEPDEHAAAHEGGDIDDNGAHLLGVRTGHLEEHVLRAIASGDDDFDAGFGELASADEEAAPGMRHEKRDRGERSLPFVPFHFVAPDPVVPGGKSALGSRAFPDDIEVAFDRLTFPGIAGRGPVREVPFFKVQVEDPSVISQGLKPADSGSLIGFPARTRPLEQQAAATRKERSAGDRSMSDRTAGEEGGPLVFSLTAASRDSRHDTNSVFETGEWPSYTSPGQESGVRERDDAAEEWDCAGVERPCAGVPARLSNGSVAAMWHI